MSDNVHDLPVGDVDFDLDALEKDPKQAVDTFAANIGDKRIEFANPEDVDWQDLVLVETPVDMVQFLVTEDDLKHIRAQRIPSWKVGELVNRILSHYRFDQKFEEAQREAARQRARTR